MLEQAARGWIQFAFNKTFKTNLTHMNIDRGKLFIIKTPPFSQIETSRILLPEEEVTFGSWLIRLTRCPYPKESFNTNWKDLWRGVGITHLPIQTYSITFPEANIIYSGLNIPLKSFWSQFKVPYILRDLFPVISKDCSSSRSNSSIQHEFLTGKTATLLQEGDSCYRVDLTEKTLFF